MYNTDEMGLNFKELPHKTMALQNECASPGLKKPKERFSVGVCSNTSGNYKFPLFVIG